MHVLSCPCASPLICGPLCRRKHCPQPKTSAQDEEKQGQSHDVGLVHDCCLQRMSTWVLKAGKDALCMREKSHGGSGFDTVRSSWGSQPYMAHTCSQGSTNICSTQASCTICTAPRQAPKGLSPLVPRVPQVKSSSQTQTQTYLGSPPPPQPPPGLSFMLCPIHIFKCCPCHVWASAAPALYCLRASCCHVP